MKKKMTAWTHLNVSVRVRIRVRVGVRVSVRVRGWGGGSPIFRAVQQNVPGHRARGFVHSGERRLPIRVRIRVKVRVRVRVRRAERCLRDEDAEEADQVVRTEPKPKGIRAHGDGPMVPEVPMMGGQGQGT